jgi:hypothetical protein
MGWRIVKQPNGLLARFSDVVDHFTHLNLGEDDALTVCMEYGCSRHEAQAKVDAGIRDLKPWTVTPGNGLERWGHCLGAVERVHGQDEVSSLLRGLTPQEKGV